MILYDNAIEGQQEFAEKLISKYLANQFQFEIAECIDDAWILDYDKIFIYAKDYHPVKAFSLDRDDLYTLRYLNHVKSFKTFEVDHKNKVLKIIA